MTDQSLMPFGKFKGCPIVAVDTGYLVWVSRNCSIGAALRAAIGDELARRGVARDDGRDDGHRPVNRDAAAPVHASHAPPVPDRVAAFELLSDLLASGVRVVARGDGAVHLYDASGLTPELRSRLYADIDALARWVLFEAPGRYRTTPAAALLARLRSRGVPVVALPGGAVVSSDGETGEDALAELSVGGKREAWLRVAANLPDPPDVASGPARSHAPQSPNALAGLHAHVAKRAAGVSSKGGGKWRAYVEAVAALRAGQAVSAAVVEDLAAHCRLQADRASGRGSEAARRWRAWAEALGARRP